MKKRYSRIYSLTFLFCLLLSIQLVNSASDFPALKHASSDFNPETGLVYQGISDKEHIYLNKEELPFQGKQKGSINLVDYNNDGEADLFTTGFYLDQDNTEIADTALYQSLETKTGNFQNLKYSSSCWSDFDNNGYLEPAMIGQDNESKSHFAIFKNEAGTLSIADSLPGLKYGDIECVDIDKDGWIDLVACGEDETGNAVSVYYRNKEGLFQLSQNLKGLIFCSISANDFNRDGFMDIAIAGEDTAYHSFFNLYGHTFTQLNTGNITPLRLPAIDSGDVNNDGLADIVLSGSGGTVLLKNTGDIFQSENLTQVKNAALQFMAPDNQLELFMTGIISNGIDEHMESQLFHLDSGTNKPPSAPESLNYKEDDILKLTWEKAEDDHTEHLFYHVRAGTNDNPNQFLSGYLSDEKGNAQLAQFKLLKNPCSANIDSFIFQVRAIESSFLLSGWSDPYTIKCTKNTSDDQLSKRWSYSKNFGKLKYYADYEVLDDSVLVTEIIENQDIFTHENISIIHPDDEVLDRGSYSLYLNGNIRYFKNQLLPNQKLYLRFWLKPVWQPEKVLTPKITSQPIIPVETIQKGINVSVETKDNKTVIKFTAKANGSNLIEKEVAVIQTLPKCLIETINELAIKSGKIKSNREFIILKEDPVIMWVFDTITTPEDLQLEIQAVADENCRNQIKTEIVAKTYLAQNTSVNTSAALIQFLIPLAIFLLFGILLKFARKTIYHKKISYSVLLCISLFFIILSIFDTFQSLPGTLDFFKKILSWLSILLLVVHLDLARLLTGLPEGIARKSRFFFNTCLISGFTLLSVKNIIFVAYESYGKEAVFSDLLLFIIKYTAAFESHLFLAGIILLAVAAIFAWLRFPFYPKSIAGTIIVHSYSNHSVRKLLLLFFIILGFYTAVFQFLFDWFSVSMDSPFLLLLVLFSWHSLRKPEIEEASIKKYLLMLTHKEHRWITLSLFSTLIFIVETYLSIFFWLTGRKNLYLDAVTLNLPSLRESLMNSSLWLQGIYLIQIAGLIAMIISATLIWLKAYRNERLQLPKLFSFLSILGLGSFLLNPAFLFSQLKNYRLSGVLLVIKDTLNTNFIFHYMTVMIILLFLILIRKTHWLSLLHNLSLAVTTITVTGLFLNSYLSRISDCLHSAIIAKGGLIPLINSLFLVASGIVYAIIIAVSLWAWIKILFIPCNQ